MKTLKIFVETPKSLIPYPRFVQIALLLVIVVIDVTLDGAPLLFFSILIGGTWFLIWERETYKKGFIDWAEAGVIEALEARIKEGDNNVALTIE